MINQIKLDVKLAIVASAVDMASAYTQLGLTNEQAQLVADGKISPREAEINKEFWAHTQVFAAGIASAIHPDNKTTFGFEALDWLGEDYDTETPSPVDEGASLDPGAVLPE